MFLQRFIAVYSHYSLVMFREIKSLKSLFQFQQRAWTQEEWEIPTVLQGLGPNDVEAEDAGPAAE
jgi:hypothetical protein